MNSTTFSFISAFRTLAVLGVVAATHAVSVAATIQLNTNSVSGANGGGSYTASNHGLDLSAYSANSRVGPQGTFETYCLEFGEHFTPGTTYDFGISYAATLGNGGAVAGQDLISRATAWLYSQFGKGTLSGYEYTVGTTRKNDNTLLQLAFWYFENEIGNGSGLLNTTVNAGNNKFVALALNPANLSDPLLAASGAFGVKVLNLTDRSGNHKQSQLYLTTSVPDTGATASLLVLALLGLAGVRRMFRR